MRGRLWLVRFALLVVVSGIVLSPLAVRGAAPSPQPVGWNHAPSAIALPSSAAYPAVVAYRELRMSFADKSFEKAELLLEYANQDAAAIATMTRRQEYVSAAAHFPTYQHTFDRCVTWLLMAEDRGNNTSYLLARVKNDHLAQQTALNDAVGSLPEWALEGVSSTRAHVATELLHAIQILEGDAGARNYAQLLVSAHPDLAGIWDTGAKPEPTPVAPPQVDSDVAGSVRPETSTATNAMQEAEPTISIVSLKLDEELVAPLGSTVVSCVLAQDKDPDDYTYSWWCSRGSLSTDGPQATWIAPEQEGTYEIAVTATDLHGNSATQSVEVRVGEQDNGLGMVEQNPEGEVANDVLQTAEDEGSTAGDSPAMVVPEITSLSATAEHHYLEQNLSGGYAILVSRDAEVHCDVVDATGLLFEWTIDGDGELSGSGETVRMTAPGRPGYVTVTVTVSNDEGEQDTGSLTFYVSTCTYCF